MINELLAGTAEIDITPPVGVDIAGGVFPRISTGIHDALKIKAIALESNGKDLVYVVADVIWLSKEIGDRAVEEAKRRSGVSVDSIVWTASHTHSGPYTMLLFAHDATDREWLATIPERFAHCVEHAVSRKQPVRVKRSRSFLHGIAHNRRVKFKDGWVVNTWLLGQTEKDTQAVGVSNCIDPEIITLSFESLSGDVRAVMFQTVLHANSRGGIEFSADYPAVVADRICRRYGNDVATLYVPGACADLNPAKPYDCDAAGNAFADSIIQGIDQRDIYEENTIVEAAKSRVTVPLADASFDFEKRLEESRWPDRSLEAFRQSLEMARSSGKTKTETVVQAWRIGDVGFASLPGEVFVETGLRLKQDSPFPWTVPVELGGDSLAYLITEKIWKEGGYEPLIGSTHPTTVEGTEILTREALSLLDRLYEAT